MSVNTETVQHVAKLSMLNIGDDEISSTTERINKVLALVDTLQDIDTTGTEPLAHPLDAQQSLRDDHAENCTDRDKLLSNAPEQLDGQFLVPRVVE